MGKETNQNDALAELPVAVTPKTIVIRSLRRRLWQAFQRDDAAAALAIYCATRSDWEGWVQQEKEQEQAALAAAKLQGSGRQPSFLMKKLLKKKKSLKDPPTPATNIPTTALGTPVGTMVGSSSNPLLQSAPTSPSSLESVSCDNNETPNVSLLQLYCDPSESFVLDDYKSLYASYEIENDDDKNAAADTLSQEAVARPASSSRPRRMHKLRMPRQAVGSFWGGQQQRAGSAGAAGVVVAEQLNTDNDASPLTTEQEAAVATSANRIDVISDARMTTPLHEAARCGSGALVRIMLGMQTQHAQQHNNNGNGNSNSNFPNQADPNVRNGALQTALHMVAGGVTDKERIRIDELERQRHYDETDKDDKDEDGESTSSSASQSSSLKHVPIVGLRRPLPIVEEVPVTHNPAAFQAKKAARAVGRFLRVIHNQKDAPPDKQSSGDKKNAAQNTDTTTVGIIISDQEWEQLQRARLDAAMAILSWSRPNNSNDGTDTNYHQYFQGGHGPSTNAVDLVGRTALHYAAELGRSAICMQLFSSFGTMLTIVDDSSRTPCELASCSKYDDLAAQLEARALLYLDPYGVDDELLAAVMADETGYLRNVLAPPFNMFETYSWDDVLRERNRRMDQTLHKMRKIADIREVEERARALMFLEVIDEKTKQSIPRDEVAKRSSELVQKKKALEPTGVKASTTQDLETSLILIAVKVITDEVSVPSAGPKVNDDSEPCLGPNATDDDSVSSPAAKATGEDLEPSPGVKATSEDLVPSPGGKATGEDLVPSPGGKTTGEDSVSSPGGKTTGEDSVSSPGANASEDLEQYSGAKATTDVHLKAADEDFVPSHGVKTTGQDSEPCPAANAIGEADNVASKEDKPREEDDKPREAALVVESLHKSHVELYLTFHVWNVDEALLAFFLGPVAAFLEAGVPLPMGSLGGDELKFRDSWALEHTCLICCDVFEADSSKWKSLQGCEHSFCIDCLGEYISDSAQSKTTGLVIPCPHHECCAPLSPLEVVNLSPDSDVYGRLLDAANENFVTSAEDLRFCPHPGCPGVVKFNLPSYIKAARISSEFLTIAGAVCTAVHGNAAACPPTYEGVYDPNYFSAVSLDQPKRAHRFCFACGDSQVHWPISCKRLDEWKSTVQEEVKDVEDEDGTDYNDVAQRLWLKANTRPCPKVSVLNLLELVSPLSHATKLFLTLLPLSHPTRSAKLRSKRMKAATI
jgi:ankyrin repeat protein